MITRRQRCAAEVVAAAMEGVRDRADIHYSQGLVLRWSGIAGKLLNRQPSYADCSSYTTWLMWRARKKVRGSAGVDIVNGQDWTEGYTGTQTNHGHRHRFGVRAYKAGRTLVFYNNDQGQIGHVAVYVGHGMVVSHGSEAGPLYLTYNYRPVAQARSYGL